MPVPESAVVHPLVLLSVVDHYNRVARDTRKRVVGILLGEASKGVVQVTNSFAVPFEEDDRDPKIWFLDHSYVDSMARMFKKVNAREKIVGWYSTGPRLREADLSITDLLSIFAETPLLVICEVEPKDMGLPTTAYYAKDEIREDGTQKSQKVFVNIPTEVGATEAEEIGVEHLLRNVKDATISTLTTEVARMGTGLRGLQGRLEEIQAYLALVLERRIPVNHDIIYQLQDVFNLLPNLAVEELTRAFAIKGNDMMLVIYLASLVRSVLALHNLLCNKEQQRQLERDAAEADSKKPEVHENGNVETKPDEDMPDANGNAHEDKSKASKAADPSKGTKP
ncbi:hypothetical protein WJX73_008123 [Symbiochloris irregularis]|uniref:MPN domain-containing protein n=1 Tax=Symbiochloris irregularis TaxID=706552 RepID=A0AAW1P1M0_9CHLO